jgi:hypothetical protein
MLVTDVVATALTKLGARRHAETTRSGGHSRTLAQATLGNRPGDDNTWAPLASDITGLL